MQSIFLGVDREDIPYINTLSPQLSFILGSSESPTWSRIITSGEQQNFEQSTRVDNQASIIFQEQEFSLPIRPWVIHKLLPEGKRRIASLQWIEAKTRSVSSVILGGGREERSYFDSIDRQLGTEVYNLFYAPFIQKRFGISGTELSAFLARELHFHKEKDASFVYHTPEIPSQSSIRWNASIEKFILKEDKIASVAIGGEEYPIQGPLYVALPIDQIVSLLTDVPKSILVDIGSVSYCDEHWVSFSGDCSKFSTETFFIDPAHPVVTAHKVSNVQIVATIQPEQRKQLVQWSAKNNLSIENEGQVHSWHPIWKTQSHFRYRRIASYLSSLGIRLVGKRALFSQKSVPELCSLQQKYPEMEITEFLRVGSIN